MSEPKRKKHVKDESGDKKGHRHRNADSRRKKKRKKAEETEATAKHLPNVDVPDDNIVIPFVQDGFRRKKGVVTLENLTVPADTSDYWKWDISGADCENPFHLMGKDGLVEPCVISGICLSIPLKAFALNSLRNVLSMQTWNDVLSSEDRNFLRTQLPGGGVQRHRIALGRHAREEKRSVRALLEGENIFFGNPVDKLWNEIRSGNSHALVQCFRQRERMLQRHDHMFYVKQYHNWMMFSIRQILSGGERSAIESRGHGWEEGVGEESDTESDMSVDT